MDQPALTAPQPRLDASPLAVYRDYLKRGELAYQVDDDDQPVFFPRIAAPLGRRGALRWATSRGLGTVYATTHISPRGEPDYNVALIDMDEGFRLMSRVESIAAEAVKIGMRVRVRVHPGGGDDAPYPVFYPAEAA